MSDLQGAYLVAGLIVLILGATGLITKVMKRIPMPIVMAMIAGAMMRFCTGMIKNVSSAPVIAIPTILAYFLTYRFKKKFPPILSAIIVGTAAALFTGAFQYTPTETSFILPSLSMPSFNLGAIISVAIPLAILVVGAENAQAIGVLTSQGYKAPVKAMTIYSGFGGIVTSFFGGHNANIAGPMTAICASEESGENLDGRYASVIINFLICGSVGLFASIIVPFITILPKTLIFTIAGLAMTGVILGAIQHAFQAGKFQMGAFFAFIIALSGVSFFKVGAPFWALVGGIVVVLLIERKDFSHFLSEAKDAA
jgi:benzoate membrane transport protein